MKLRQLLLVEEQLQPSQLRERLQVLQMQQSCELIFEASVFPFSVRSLVALERRLRDFRLKVYSSVGRYFYRSSDRVVGWTKLKAGHRPGGEKTLRTRNFVTE